MKLVNRHVVQIDMSDTLQDNIKQTFVPTSSDPLLFVVSCREGKEKRAVVSLMTKKMFCQFNAKPFNILSASMSFTVPGKIYIEAFKEAHVRDALVGIDGMFLSKVKQVP
jgi:transcription elongation factor SPT5